MLRLSELKLPLAHAPDALAALIAKTLDVPVEAIASHTVFKRSFDARKADLLTVYICDVQLADAGLEAALLAKHAGHPHIQPAPDMAYAPPAHA
ncbi:MAG TPA: FAD-dependent oxidoreductase, partial [Variovorax sp.]|nr:FAD-dependent oxidoreductase [Variovorax sp.]